MEGSTGDAAEELATNDGPAPEDAGHDVTSMVDAGDASDAGPKPVTVMVFGASGAEQGVTVVFGDATGAVVGTPATSDSAGFVAQVLPAGATTITALLGTATNPSPYTVLGVQPGDFLVVPDFTSLAPYATGLLDVTALPASPPANTAGYYATVGACAASAAMPPITVGFAGTACFGLGAFGGKNQGVVPVLVEASDPNGNLLGFTFQNANPLSAFAADAGTLSVSLAGDTWSTATTTQTIAVTNPPDGSTLSTYVGESANAVLRELSQVTVVDDAGVQTTVVTTHPGYADSLQTEVAIVNPQWAVGTVVGAAPPTSNGTVNIDATSLGTLPQISAVMVDSTVAAQPKLTWTLAQGSLAAAAGLVAYASWTGTNDAGAAINGNWTIVAPSSASSIQVPALPATASAYAPPAGASFQGTVQGLAGSLIPGYAQLRSVGGAIASPPTAGCVAWPVLPSIGTGTLSVTIFTTALCG